MTPKAGNAASSVNPVVSVVIATYNWSAALRCAIQSVLLQTFSDFEILVVGDGCTDDSEQAVLAFEDSRIRWMNLASNSGSQAAPNNAGIAAAKGEYIAYLGHDDVWYPAHLETLVATAQREQADVAGAVMLLYGPPTSGVMSVSGLFGSGEYSPHEFMPPSSILHKKALVEKIGAWTESLELQIPIDVEFLGRAAAAGAKIVSSGELTVFKFNAAMRRNAYLIKSTVEQEAILAKIQSGVDFRLSAMIAFAQSVVSGKHIRVAAPQPGAPGAWYRYNARFKGTLKQQGPLQSLHHVCRFYLDDQLGGCEWHAPEPSEQWTSSRWSGPSHESTLEFPVLWRQGLSIVVQVLAHFQRHLATDVQLFVNGEQLETTVEPGPTGATLLRAALPPRPSDAAETEQPENLRITFRVAATRRPLDLGINEDGRWLGISVNWVELGPL